MSVVQLPRLECCTPTAYDGASTTLVHAYYCEKSKGQPLSVDEWASLRKLIVAQEPNFEKAQAQAHHPVNYQTRRKVKPKLIYCRCSSPVMPCPLHKDVEDWWEA